MNYENIEFQFIENDTIGLNSIQIDYIKNLIKKYMKEYPKVILKTVCDYFSWDYSQNELNEYTYTHNTENELYSSNSALGKYNNDDKLIGINHIRLSNVKLDDTQIVTQIEQNKKKLQKLQKSLKKIQRQAKFTGQDIPTFNEILAQEFKGSDLNKHEIFIDSFTDEYIDVLLVRRLEECIFIKRVVSHEFGHAIAYSYNLEEDAYLKSLYKKFENGFEDIQEFIAECFMASELTNKIPLANNVKNRIDEIIKSTK